MFRRINQRILSIKLVLVLKKEFVSQLWPGFLRVFSSLASAACNPGPSFNMRSVFKFSNMLVYCSSQSPLFARAVLLVADLFHPVDNLAVELFLNGDVRHGSGRRGPVSALLARGLRELHSSAHPLLARVFLPVFYPPNGSKG